MVIQQTQDLVVLLFLQDTKLHLVQVPGQEVQVEMVQLRMHLLLLLHQVQRLRHLLLTLRYGMHLQLVIYYFMVL
ncbi:MAG: hypothetical protein EBR82_49710 [Caulobacteraceae bacterium]|nr:hypothetical protein [Caulobacteraceae bacterium]